MLTLVLAAVVLTSAAMADDGRPPLPKPIKGDHCVEPTPVMRRSHFEFLFHQREQTLREGMNGGKYSIQECVSCHVSKDASGKYIPVNAPGQFCQSCHAYAAVSIDCFSCHATTPDGSDGGKTAAR